MILSFVMLVARCVMGAGDCARDASISDVMQRVRSNL